MAYDVIGDIHGHADALIALLGRLGYRDHRGAYRHPDRTAVFLGDFIDRGLQNEAVVVIVRRMVDAGSALAVMGNHELNAIQYHTLGPHGAPLRSHNDKHTIQHESFLEEFNGRPRDLDELINWFRTLSLYRDLGGLRVVHAFWHTTQIQTVAPYVDSEARLTDPGLIATSKQGTDPGDSTARSALEDLLKGPEVLMPNDLYFEDKEGFRRYAARIGWWKPSGSTWRDVLLVPRATREQLPTTVFESLERYQYPADAVPVMFGHYWANGDPEPFSANTACLDWSVAKGGKLAAYRFDGEPRLRAEQFVWVGPNGG